MEEGPFVDDLDLDAVTTREELAQRLRDLHARADSPSLRNLETWALKHGKEALSRSTLSDMLGGRRFPKKARMLVFLQGCGVPENKLVPWRRAWERIAAAEQERRHKEAAELDRDREQVLTQARLEAAELLEEAHQRASQHLEEARQQAEQILSEGRAEADKITAEAEKQGQLLLRMKMEETATPPKPQAAPAAPVTPPSTPPATPVDTVSDAVKTARKEGQDLGESVLRDAPVLWVEAVLARKPRMPSDLERRLLHGSSLPIDFLLHDEVRHALRRGFWDALEQRRVHDALAYNSPAPPDRLPTVEELLQKAQRERAKLQRPQSRDQSSLTSGASDRRPTDWDAYGQT